MAVGTGVQSPNEAKIYSLNYRDTDSPWLTGAEQLTGTPTVTITPVTVPPLVISSVTLTSTNSRISFKVTGGLAGTKYHVVFLADTTTGQKEEVQVNISVRAVH